MDETYHLRGTIIDGKIDRDEMWVENGLITYSRPPHPPREMIDGYVLPGLVDVHCHIGLGEDGPVGPEEQRRQAVADRDGGTLLIRDAGVGVDTRWIDREPDLPRILRAGQHIARPRRYLRHFAREIERNDLPSVIVSEAIRGSGWTKLVGDWIDRDLGIDADLRPLWDRETLFAAVCAAHQAGARVTTHVFSRTGARDALDAGVDCIEHGCGMDQELMDRAARRGVPVVPTMLQRENFLDFAEQAEGKYPIYASRMRRLYRNRKKQARELYEAGVRLLVGSDSGGTIRHGSTAAEAVMMAEAGIPAPTVVAAASWDARDFLGVPGIQEGAPADLVVYRKDPREDIRQLLEPQAVILRGKRIF